MACHKESRLFGKLRILGHRLQEVPRTHRSLRHVRSIRVRTRIHQTLDHSHLRRSTSRGPHSRRLDNLKTIELEFPEISWLSVWNIPPKTDRCVHHSDRR